MYFEPRKDRRNSGRDGPEGREDVGKFNSIHFLMGQSMALNNFLKQ